MRNPCPWQKSFWIIAFILFMTTSPSSQQKFPLTFSPPVGEELLYMLDTSVQVKGKDFGGREISLGATASGEISLTIKRTVGDLVFIGLTIPGIQVQAQTLRDLKTTSSGPKRHGCSGHIRQKRPCNRDPQPGCPQSRQDLEPFLRPDPSGLSARIAEENPCLSERPGKTKRTLKFLSRGWTSKSRSKGHISCKISSPPIRRVALDFCGVRGFTFRRKKHGRLEGSFEGKGPAQDLLNFYIQRNCIQEFKAEYQTEANFNIKKEINYFKLGLSISMFPFPLST